MRALAALARRSRALLKVILETALLSTEEKILACQLCLRAKADFVKTSTGFSSAGATAADVALMRGVVGHEMGVKAAGGIRYRLRPAGHGRGRSQPHGHQRQCLHCAIDGCTGQLSEILTS